MKKFYSFLLMATALLIGMNLQAEVRTAGTFDELTTALSQAAAGDVIELTADIAYPKNGKGLINITKSLTLDGKGHKISGYGARGSVPNVIAINYNNTSYVDVTLKNLDIYSTEYRPLETRGYITKLTLDNVTITSTGGSANPQGLTIGGYQTSEPYAQLIIKDSKINLTHSGYPVIFWNPTIVTATNSDFNGYCGLYFKTDAKHSVVNADACNFDAPNVHSGASNDFAVFALEDGDMTFNLNNCGMNGERIGNQGQSLFCLSEWTLDENRVVGAINITLSGDNSYFNVSNDVLQNGYIWKNPSGSPQYGPKSEGYYKEMAAEDAVNVTVNFTITGGTYSVNPANLIFKNNYYMTKEGDEWVEHYDAVPFTIPSGYEVIEMKTNQNGQETTLYRVRKTITTAYNINDNVESQGEGQNANTEFKITADDEIAENIDEVVANYVEVSNNATLTVGENKTLDVTNGMDVKEGAQVVVEPGATVIVGEGGVVAESAEGIVIESSETKPASFLLDPEVIVNTTPLLTVKMIANVGKDGEDWYWHRFAMPVNGITSWTKQNEAGTEITVPTYLQGWDYGKQDWDARTVDQMVPFLGYTLTYDQVDGVATTGETKVVYVFKGNLVGNLDIDLNFQNKGYNYFGNSYTAFIDAKTLLANVMNDPTIGGAVYMWDAENQGYSAVTMRDLRDFPDRLEDFEKEVAPMQTFILQLRSDNKPSVFVDYKNAIWGNPRYGKVASAPARMVADNDTYAKITVTAENGKTDAVRLNENAQFSDEYENGMDADKFINSNNVNIYANVNGNNYSTVATDNLEGKMISLQTKKGSHYTLSFSHISGTEYAVKDMLTGIVTPMTADNTYEFVAGENTLNENRFMIVRRANMPTDAETVEATAARKGIYTIMGQYVGETDMFNTLPAGIYVVDGVKVVR